MSNQYNREGNITAIVGVLLLAPLFFAAYRSAIGLPVGSWGIIVTAAIIGLICLAAGWGGKK